MPGFGFILAKLGRSFLTVISSCLACLLLFLPVNLRPETLSEDSIRTWFQNLDKGGIAVDQNHGWDQLVSILQLMKAVDLALQLGLFAFDTVHAVADVEQVLFGGSEEFSFVIFRLVLVLPQGVVLPFQFPSDIRQFFFADIALGYLVLAFLDFLFPSQQLVIVFDGVEFLDISPEEVLVGKEYTFAGSRCLIGFWF